MPQSASVTIEIEQVDNAVDNRQVGPGRAAAAAKGMDEPLDRGARPAIADLDPLPPSRTDGAPFFFF